MPLTVDVMAGRTVMMLGSSTADMKVDSRELSEVALLVDLLVDMLGNLLVDW